MADFESDFDQEISNEIDDIESGGWDGSQGEENEDAYYGTEKTPDLNSLQDSVRSEDLWGGDFEDEDWGGVTSNYNQETGVTTYDVKGGFFGYEFEYDAHAINGAMLGFHDEMVVDAFEFLGIDVTQSNLNAYNTLEDVISLVMTIINIPASFALIQAGKAYSAIGVVKLATQIHDIIFTVQRIQERYGISSSDFEMEFDKHYAGDEDVQFALQKSTEVLVAQASATKTQLGDFLYGNLFDWMPGGIFYAAIYAGGNFFNSTGSLSQTRFVGNGDKNMNDELWLRLGVYGETPRKKLGSLAGDEGFSVVNFGG